MLCTQTKLHKGKIYSRHWCREQGKPNDNIVSGNLWHPVYEATRMICIGDKKKSAGVVSEKTRRHVSWKVNQVISDQLYHKGSEDIYKYIIKSCCGFVASCCVELQTFRSQTRCKLRPFVFLLLKRFVVQHLLRND